MADERPVQHTPKHLEKDADVFDPRHPAASAFAVAQPAAGVVADDVEEKGQNLRGGPTAQEASGTYADQREVLAEQHRDTLRRKSGVSTTVTAPAAKDDSETRKDDMADAKSNTTKTDTKSTAAKPRT